jgi:hypothetical protein
MSNEATVEKKPLRKKSLFIRLLWLLLAGLSFCVAVILVAWAAGALYFDLQGSAPVRTTAAIVWVVVAAVTLLFGGLRGRVLVLIAFVGIVGWWLTLRPTQDANWQPDVARLAHATIQGDGVTVHDIRNFDYRTASGAFEANILENHPDFTFYTSEHNNGHEDPFCRDGSYNPDEVRPATEKEIWRRWQFAYSGNARVPIWVVRVPKEIIWGHGGLWSDNSVAMLAALFRIQFPLPPEALAALRSAGVAPRGTRR